MAINRSAEAMTIFSVIQAVYFQLYTWGVHGWRIGAYESIWFFVGEL
jgi:hypothetical protein